MTECKQSSTISLELTLNMGLHHHTDMQCKFYETLLISSRMYVRITQCDDGPIRPAFQNYEHAKQSLWPVQPRKAAQRVFSGLLDSELIALWVATALQATANL